MCTPDMTALRAKRAAYMDKTIEVQALTRVKLPNGATTEQWTTLAGGTLVGNKWRKQGATLEGLIGGAPSPRAFYDIHLPYTSAVLALGITAQHRLLVDGELLEIAAARKPDSYATTVYLLAAGRL